MRGKAFTRAGRAIVGATLAGGLVLASTPTASADATRDAEWPLTQYSAEQKVWPISTGKGVIVAVIDSGVRATHVDLRGQVLPGTDFAYGGNGETDHDPSGAGHGTAMASLIAGHGHGANGQDGIKGLAPGAKILPIGIGTLLQEGSGPDYIAQAIRYAVDHGASVISMSLGMDTPDDADEQAVAYAEAHNVVLVAATGNDGLDKLQYPANYPGVIAVGGITKDDTIWDGENYGHLTVVAPAVGIVADNNGSDTQFAQGDGTSNATAYVSAIAALVRAKFPHLTAGQVVNRIIKSAALPQGITAPDAKWGYGVARPYAALTHDIPAGPASGPLPQATQAASAAASSPATTAASSSKGSSSAGLIIAAVAIVVVLGVVVLVVVLLRRRGNRNGPGGDGSGGGVPSPYPPTYQYPNSAPPAQPYAQPQQPPYQGYQPPQSPYPGNPYAQPPQNPGSGEAQPR